MTLSRLVRRYHSFGGTHCFHLQPWRCSVCLIRTLVSLYLSIYLIIYTTLRLRGILSPEYVFYDDLFSLILKFVPSCVSMRLSIFILLYLSVPVKKSVVFSRFLIWTYKIREDYDMSIMVVVVLNVWNKMINTDPQDSGLRYNINLSPRRQCCTVMHRLQPLSRTQYTRISRLIRLLLVRISYYYSSVLFRVRREYVHNVMRHNF